MADEKVKLPPYPRPYLTRQEADERLSELGFQFFTYPDPDHTKMLVDTPEQRKKFQVLIELIAGAIAEWADVKDDFGDNIEEGELDPETINLELQDWAQEWLVG